jgi:hypothetical protein
MLGILENFESAMSGDERLSPAVLIAPGAAAVAAGLFVWLAGLSFKRLLAATSGAIGGGLLAAHAIGVTALPAAGSAAATTIVAAAFERVFIIALASGLATALVLAFFMGPYIEISSSTEAQSRADSPAQAATLSAGQSMRKVQAWVADAGAQLESACSQMQAHKWALAVALGIGVVIGGSLLWRLTAALYFSATGTILVFAGMILLLLYKGAMPVSRICSRPSAYSGLFAAMVVFGTAEQMLLCRGAKAQPAEQKTDNKRHRSAKK